MHQPVADASTPPLTGDPYRPRYHFTPPKNWMNDPNGLIQWRETYHLFYQHNPFGALWGNMHWGHAVSRDLVHWEHLPIALAPSPDGPDADGCFSGCAFDHNGQATILYTGVRGDDQRPCLATSDDDLLRTWTRFAGNPVIPEPPSDLDIVFFRDHTVWQEDGAWYQGIGSGIEGEGGAVLLYRSTDLQSWEYLHPLVVGDARQTEPFPTGTGWECPDFFAVDGSHGLIVASHDNGGLNVAWMTGDYLDHRFSPTRQGLVDAGPSFYAPQSFTDDVGQRVMIGWLRERRDDEEQVEAGWSGAMTLPRILTIAGDGALHSAPAPEIANLRGKHTQIPPDSLAGSGALDAIRGDAVEILATFEAPAEEVGLAVRRTDDGSEETRIVFDPATRTLTLDTSRASTNPHARGAVSRTPVEPSAGEDVTLRVFVDRSVIEVFLNERIAISDRVYPTNPASDGIAVIGAPHIRSLDVWEMRALAEPLSSLERPLQEDVRSS